jgi:hypothetical protein
MSEMIFVVGNYKQNDFHITFFKCTTRDITRKVSLSYPLLIVQFQYLHWTHPWEFDLRISLQSKNNLK